MATTKTKPRSYICYKRNFLDQVIFRLDFSSPLNKINTSLPPKIRTALKKDFPIAEPMTPLLQQFSVRFDLTSSKKSKGLQTPQAPTPLRNWKFHNKTKTHTIDISQAAVVLDISEFSTYKGAKAEFMTAVNAIASNLPKVSGARLGLRYRNNIKLPGTDPFSWEKYLNPRLSSFIKDIPADSEVIRNLHSMEIRFPQCNLRLETGMPNPDYPAVIRRKEFLLDIDAYRSDIIEMNEIAKLLDDFHKRIQHYFEDSITDDLRTLLNA